MRTMGVSVPSLHRESTDSLIVKLDATRTCHIQIYQRLQRLLLRYANLKLTSKFKNSMNYGKGYRDCIKRNGDKTRMQSTCYIYCNQLSWEQ